MSVLAGLAVVWALLALGATLTALVRRRAPVAPRPVGPSLDVVVLRPLDAPTPQELENLGAPLPPGVRQIVLSPFRPRIPERVEWLPSDPPAQNRKLGHLHYALEVLARDPGRAGRDAPEFEPAPLRRVVIADADVRVDAALLGSLLGALDAGADAAWAAPRPETSDVVRGVLVQSLQAFEVSALLGPAPQAMCGKAMALSGPAVALFRALPDCVGEDLELATRLHGAGLTLTLAGHARLPGATSAPLQRFTRWMQVLRAHRRLLFPTVPLFVACTPVLVALAAVLREPVLTALVLAVVVGRTWLAQRSERVEPGGHSALWWLPAEGLLLVAWLWAVGRGGQVEWRGRRLQLGPGGALVASTARAT